MMCRFEEMIQSIRIIRQAIRELPDGAIKCKMHLNFITIKKDVYGNIEGLMNQSKLTFEGIKKFQKVNIIVLQKLEMEKLDSLL